MFLVFWFETFSPNIFGIHNITSSNIFKETTVSPKLINTKGLNSDYFTDINESEIGY